MKNWFYIGYEFSNSEIWIDLNDLIFADVNGSWEAKRDKWVYRMVLTFSSGIVKELELTDLGLADLKDALFPIPPKGEEE